MFGVQETNLQELQVPDNVADEITLVAQPKNKRLLKLFFFWFVLRALLEAIRVRPNYIYVSDSAACPAARLIYKTLKIDMLYHEHDAPPAATSRKANYINQARRFVAQRAKLCIIPNEERAEDFSKTIAPTTPPCVVWNCPGTWEIPSLPSPNSSAGTEFRVVYAGSLNDQRVPHTILHAAAQIPNLHLTLIGYETVGSQGFVNSFMNTAREANIANRVRYLGKVSTRREIFDEILKSDVALSLMPIQSSDINMQSMAGASNKAFDGLTCRVPLLVSDLPDWHRVFVEAGVARACDPRDANSLFRELNWYMTHPKERMAMGKRGRQLIDNEWNYEQQFSRVLARIHDL